MQVFVVSHSLRLVSVTLPLRSHVQLSIAVFMVFYMRRLIGHEAMPTAGASQGQISSCHATASSCSSVPRCGWTDCPCRRHEQDSLPRGPTAASDCSCHSRAVRGGPWCRHEHGRHHRCEIKNPFVSYGVPAQWEHRRTLQLGMASLSVRPWIYGSELSSGICELVELISRRCVLHGKKIWEGLYCPQGHLPWGWRDLGWPSRSLLLSPWGRCFSLSRFCGVARDGIGKSLLPHHANSARSTSARCRHMPQLKRTLSQEMT